MWPHRRRLVVSTQIRETAPQCHRPVRGYVAIEHEVKLFAASLNVLLARTGAEKSPFDLAHAGVFGSLVGA